MKGCAAILCHGVSTVNGRSRTLADPLQRVGLFHFVAVDVTEFRGSPSIPRPPPSCSVAVDAFGCCGVTRDSPWHWQAAETPSPSSPSDQAIRSPPDPLPGPANKRNSKRGAVVCGIRDRWPGRTLEVNWFTSIQDMPVPNSGMIPKNSHHRWKRVCAGRVQFVVTTAAGFSPPAPSHAFMGAFP